MIFLKTWILANWDNMITITLKNKKRSDTYSSDIVKVDRLKSLIQSTFLLYLE